MSKNPAGSIIWFDLTVQNAAQVRDFYAAVVGWTPADVVMGDYNDFNMVLPDREQPVAGICHAHSQGSTLPPQWLIYIWVADIDESVRQVEALGGEVIDGPRRSESGAVAVIRDPAGATVALIAGR